MRIMPCLFVPVLLLLVVGSVSVAAQSAEAVTFCTGGCNTGRPQSCYPGVAHGKAHPAGRVPGYPTQKAFKPMPCWSPTRRLVANTTPCYHDCSSQPLCCWAIFTLEGSNSTIGAYFPTPASPSPSRPYNDPGLPEWAIVIMPAAGAGLLILAAALVGVCLYRQRKRVAYDYHH